jgi:hypothetical protein
MFGVVLFSAGDYALNGWFSLLEYGPGFYALWFGSMVSIAAAQWQGHPDAYF